MAVQFNSLEYLNRQGRARNWPPKNMITTHNLKTSSYMLRNNGGSDELSRERLMIEEPSCLREPCL
jgi:hypothetical protein